MSTAGPDEAAAGGATPPATGDPPRGAPESSWWPLVAAAGAAGLYTGVGLIAVARGKIDFVDPRLGAVVAVLGGATVVAGLLGWTYHAFVAGYWAGLVDDTRPYRLGLSLFLATEVATFGTVFAYYAFVRVGPWPPGPLPPLLSSIVAANTVALLASSVTLHVAHGALRQGNRRRFVGLLAVTVLLGLGFIVGQVVEYVEFVVHEGFTLSSGVFASAFFGLTGLHGLHVSLGVALLSVLLVRALGGQYGPDRHASVTTVSLYWHFVDGVWVVLVLALYVGATVP